MGSKRVMSHTARSSVCKLVSALEETNPKEGLKALRRLELQNKKALIFLPAVFCPIIAFFIMQGISGKLDGHLWPWAAILITVGFMPPLIIEERRIQKLEVQYGNRPGGYLVINGRAILRAIAQFFSTLIPLFVTFVVGVLLSLPILFFIDVLLYGTPSFGPSDMPLYILGPVVGGFMALVFLTIITAMFHDVPPEKIFHFIPQMVKRIPIALRCPELRTEILPLVIGFVIFYLMYGAGFELIKYEYSELAEATFAGIMLGLYIADRSKTDHILANLLRIAKARCLVRLGREDEALFILRDITEDRWYPPEFSRTPVVKHVAQALRYFILDLDRYRKQKNLPSNHPVLQDVASNRMTEGLSSCWEVSENGPTVDYPYIEVYEAAEALRTARNEYIEEYIDSIDRTRRLVGLGGNQSIGRLINAPLKSS